MHTNAAPLPPDAVSIRPLLKWAGGKTQLLGNILPKIPKKYGRFIEPFFGGGAVFFAVRPENGIIADSNPELVNLYRSVATDVNGVIDQLRSYENTEVGLTHKPWKQTDCAVPGAGSPITSLV